VADPTSTAFHCELAWLGGEGVTSDVLVETEGGRITAISSGVPSRSGATRLSGLTLPGLVNAHSHAFHRAIRGRTQSGVADFWAWRRLMYAVAERLNPELMYDLARATYAEMALSGVTSVGEFHYLHHDTGGARYGDPNAMGEAVVRAANDAGLRITLLDTCYLQADVDGAALAGVQQRFGDGSWEAWAQRVDDLRIANDRARTGAALHSVRAVPRSAMRPLAEFARSAALPLHVHLSEQPAENAASRQAFGVSPTEVLAAEGVLGPTTTAVHATHLRAADVELLGTSATSICMCCTTERDLADGVGPAVQLAAAGAPLCVGSDSHAVIDLWEEARAIELDERLVTGRRGHLRAGELASALTANGAASIGGNAGRLAVGALADLVTVRLDSPRTAGADSGDALAHVLFAGTAADVSSVVVAGRLVVEDGQHAAVEDVGKALQSAVAACLAD
jgi:formiminoglutamate deiminase